MSKEQQIKVILEKLAYSGSRPIDRQRCDVADVHIQAALTSILSLIAEEQKEVNHDQQRATADDMPKG